MRKLLIAMAALLVTGAAVQSAHASGTYKLSVRFDGKAMCFWAGNDCIVTPQ